jgi:hypothetical protein
MSSYNKFNNNLLRYLLQNKRFQMSLYRTSFFFDCHRDVFIVPFMDCFTGIYAGFAIFSVLGYMKQQKCIDNFVDVVAKGPS